MKLSLIADKHLKRPLSFTKTILIMSSDAPKLRLLSTILRQHTRYRVLEAAGPVEGRYLAGVEGRINLLLADSRVIAQRDFARWFLTKHPEAVVLVANGSLRHLVRAGEGWEPQLVCKSYTPRELVMTVRRLLASEPPARSNGRGSRVPDKSRADSAPTSLRPH